MELGQSVKDGSNGFSQMKITRHSMKRWQITDLQAAGFTSPKIKQKIGYVSDSGAGGGYEGSSKHLMQKFETLVKSLDQGLKSEYEFKFEMEDAFPEVYTVQTETADALIEFLEAVRCYGIRREAEGHKKGENLIERLAVGKISIDDLNEISLRGKK